MLSRAIDNTSRAPLIIILLLWAAITVATWTWAGGAAVNWPELNYLRAPGTIAVSLGVALLGVAWVLWGNGWRTSCAIVLFGLAIYSVVGLVALTVFAGSGHLILTLTTLTVATALTATGTAVARR